jgi:tetratricopeptide (TPR) repeat protein
VVEQAPDFTEGWNRRAFVHFQLNNVRMALGDLRRALALDPNHFKALDGLAQVLRDIGEKPAALEVLRRLAGVHPYWSGAEQTIVELEREVEGQGI